MSCWFLQSAVKSCFRGYVRVRSIERIRHLCEALQLTKTITGKEGINKEFCSARDALHATRRDSAMLLSVQKHAALFQFQTAAAWTSGEEQNRTFDGLLLSTNASLIVEMVRSKQISANKRRQLAAAGVFL